MTREDGSPLAVVTGSTDSTAASEVFRVLNDETRLAILLALWEAQDPTDAKSGVSFSALRNAVGVRDSGQFNYHLKKLGGMFVESTDAGYRLTPGGLSFVRSVVAGTGSEATLSPSAIAVDCHNCGNGTRIAYEDGWLYHLCPSCDADMGLTGHADPEFGAVLFQEPLPPSILANRTPEEVFTAGVFGIVNSFRKKAGGLCPECSGVTELSVDVCETHDASDGLCPDCGRRRQAYAEWNCSVCRFHGETGPATVALVSPAAVAFYHERDADLITAADDFGAAVRTMAAIRGATTEVVGTDPPRFVVSTTHAEETLRLTLDERLRVVESEVVETTN